MIATIALIAATAFAIVAAWRLVPSAPQALGRASLAAALAAGAFGVAVWRGGDDSRWLVAGLIVFVAAPVTILAASRRGLRVAALILGVLALALMGIATVSPRVTAPPSALNP